MGFRPVPCPGVSTGISAAAPGAFLCLWFLYRSRSSFSAPVSRAQVFWLTSLAPFFRPLRVGHRRFFRAVRLGCLALLPECLRSFLLVISFRFALVDGHAGRVSVGLCSAWSLSGLFGGLLFSFQRSRARPSRGIGLAGGSCFFSFRSAPIITLLGVLVKHFF